MQRRSYRNDPSAYPQNGYQVETIPTEEAETPVLSEEAGAKQKRKTINIIRILIGVAVILVSTALLLALITWLKQDIRSSMLFLQSEIQ